MDLDGNDFYFVKEILQSGVRPIIFICEYNGFVPPDVEWKQSYNSKHVWDGSTYYGAALISYTKLFQEHDYSLVCCNLSGANAFFIKNDHIDKFKDIYDATDEFFVYPLASISTNQSLNYKKMIQSIIDGDLSNENLKD